MTTFTSTSTHFAYANVFYGNQFGFMTSSVFQSQTISMSFQDIHHTSLKKRKQNNREEGFDDDIYIERCYDLSPNASSVYSPTSISKRSKI